MTDAAIRVSPRPVIIVDAFGRGAMLAQTFNEHVPCIHVSSRTQMPHKFLRSFHGDLFTHAFNGAQMGLETLVRELAAHQPLAVVTGNEFGVELADALAERLGLLGNGVALSRARRDKYEMAMAAARAGVPIARQLRTPSESAATAFFDALNARAVVKPVNSAGSDDVFICRSRDEVINACRKIIGATNLMLAKNTQVIIQEYLEGAEFAVNCVSHNGRHWVTDIWDYKKRLIAGGRRKIYDFEDLIDGNGREARALSTYARAVLTALGIKYGPSHTEIILTANGPRLVETGARVTGQHMPRDLGEMTETNQIEMTLWCYLHPSKMRRFPENYVKRSNARIMDFIAHENGILDQERARRQLAACPSFRNVTFRVDDKSPLNATTDLSSAAGAAFFLHREARQIEKDYAEFRAWEASEESYNRPTEKKN